MGAIHKRICSQKTDISAGKLPAVLLTCRGALPTQYNLEKVSVPRQTTAANVQSVGEEYGWKCTHHCRRGKCECRIAGRARIPYNYALKQVPQGMKQPRAAFWRNRDFFDFDSPPAREVKNRAKRARVGSMHLVYISEIDI